MTRTKIDFKKHLVIIFIIIFGFCFRLIGLNWDQGQHLHPDERFLTMVLTEIKIPRKLSDYLNPQVSSLNPYNHGFDFFVYGSFPISFIRTIGHLLSKSDYQQIYLIGRLVSICLDTSIIFLIFLITSRIFNRQTAFLAAFLYSISVLPVQLSHFFTVDPFLNFFLVLTFYGLVTLKNNRRPLLFLTLISLSYGLALASKISAAYFAPVIFLFFLFYFRNDFKKLLIFGFYFSVLTLFFFRLGQPQVFSTGNFLNWNLNPQFVSNLKDLQSYDRNPAFPPAIQWLKVVPLIFPLKNILFWGLGIPAAFIFILSLVYTLKLLIKKKSISDSYLFIIVFWILFLFVVQGMQAVSTMRYFLPIYPFISIISAVFLYHLLTTVKVFQSKLIQAIVSFCLFIYPLSFISIFFQDHPRVAASKWIYQHLPAGSTLATEYWDDSLPLSIGNSFPSIYQYQSLQVADYPDTTEKITILSQQLSQTDYLILSSNRFYLPIPANSDTFPNTSKYYQSLFSGELGFTPIAQFTSYPCFFSFCFHDDLAEEAFTVYDHPKVIVFQKKQP